MTTKKQKGHVARNDAALTTKPKHTGNSIEAQRARLLEALEKGPLTTIEIRRDLDILMPAARIWDLRHRLGKNISMEWADQPTDGGRMHRVARYCLLPSAQSDLFAVLDSPFSPNSHHKTAHVI
ncbi:helix-turn-helix domain-containing protein [Paraburkholderia caribensis]|uniref:helix-turn-helix domain-containing protein n=1 Tax=Paraburkholderia caribensis TaxID=75105 RepID=UPI001CABA374|nr:helix-turn-helix domain-containing protein [Paraburkholderia caribensis]CAG9244911.1 conserved hypothetical protein [Paraburkholderia caribensis]